MSKKVVVVGGGWSGCAASLIAKKAGCEVELFERSDRLLGAGLVGGIMRNNGRFTATEEAMAMGCGELFEITDSLSLHRNVDFPKHRHASLYDVTKIEPPVRKALLESGVKIRFRTRVRGVEFKDGLITKVLADTQDGGTVGALGDAFVDASGTSGPQDNCARHGNGCATCIYRCATFGPRFSIAAKAGAKETVSERPDGGLGAMSGSCNLQKDSLSPEIRKKLEDEGVCITPIPEALQKNRGSMTGKACSQYALGEFSENLVLLDTGHAKMMATYFPLQSLRQLPGFSCASYEYPGGGSTGNSMRYFGMLSHDNALRVNGLLNVFCCGEKAGLLVGHTEAIITGSLAGRNAAMSAQGLATTAIPESLACGDIIAYVGERMKTKEGLAKRYTFSGAEYFKRMKEKGLYTTDVEKIKSRVEKAGMTGAFSRKPR
jgi:hypothetical protein